MTGKTTLAVTMSAPTGQLPRQRRRAFMIPLEARRAKAFRAAYRHSRMVRTMRVFLPAATVVIFASYMLTSNISMTIGDGEASVSRVEIDGKNLRMINPKMEGVTKDKGTYKITAAFAEQDIANAATMRLDTIKAVTTDAKKGWSRLTAPKGTFYTKDEKLDLFGPIEVTSNNGLAASLNTATIDMKTQTVRSHDPVLVQLLNGSVRAQTMELHMGERRVLFRDKVRVHMRKRAPKKLVKAQ